jgi:hypothetical protein
MGDGAEAARVKRATDAQRPAARPPAVSPAPDHPVLDLNQTVGNQALLPAVRGGSDMPVRQRVRRADIASRGKPAAGWFAQFAPQKPPADPTNVSSIKEAQAWVKDLGGFERDEKRRFKIGEHLRSMIERLPPEVWLPSNDVISESETLIVTGTIGPIDTEALRNKLYTAYVSVERPAELTDRGDPTALQWAPEIEPYVGPDEQDAAQRFGLTPLLTPFRLDRAGFTWREIHVLEFLFPDEMLEWRRRDVEVQDSVVREYDRRTGVFMAALGQGSIKAIGQFFKISAMGGLGMASAPIIAGRIGLGLGVRSIASAGWGTRFLVGTGTGQVIGAAQGAVDSALTNLPDVVRGDISAGDYAGGIAGSTWEGAKWGGAIGAAGSIAAPVLSRFWNLVRPAARAPTAGAALADDAAAATRSAPGRPAAVTDEAAAAARTPAVVTDPATPTPAPAPGRGPLIVDLQSGPQVGIHPNLPGFGAPNLLPRLVGSTPGARGVAVEGGDWLIGYPTTRAALPGVPGLRIPGASPTTPLDLQLSRQLVQSTPHWPPYRARDVGRALRGLTDPELAAAPFTLQPWQINPGAAFPRSGPVVVLTEGSGAPSAFFPPLGGRPGPGLPQRLVPINQADVVALQPSTHPALHGRVDQIYWRRPFALTSATPDVVTQMGQEVNRMLRPGGFIEFRVLASGDVQVARGLAAQIPGARVVEVPRGAIRTYGTTGTRPPGLNDEQWQILEAAGPDIRGELSQLGQGRFNRIIRVFKGL